MLHITAPTSDPTLSLQWRKEECSIRWKCVDFPCGWVLWCCVDILLCPCEYSLIWRGEWWGCWLNFFHVEWHVVNERGWSVVSGAKEEGVEWRRKLTEMKRMQKYKWLMFVPSGCWGVCVTGEGEVSSCVWREREREHRREKRRMRSDEEDDGWRGGSTEMCNLILSSLSHSAHHSLCSLHSCILN